MDINCDLGESLAFLETGHDARLMKYITSANIACGFHAGNEYIMAKTIENALENGVLIGAHPGFKDKKNFGRLNIELSQNEIADLISIQLENLKKLAGDKIHHVKPHGALYNMSAQRTDYASAIARSVLSFDPQLILYGLSESYSITEANKIGLSTYSEVFADRAYHSDGRLVSRHKEGSVLTDGARIDRQIKGILNRSPVLSYENTELTIKGETICIHSDTQNALEIAKRVYHLVKSI